MELKLMVIQLSFLLAFIIGLLIVKFRGRKIPHIVKARFIRRQRTHHYNIGVTARRKLLGAISKRKEGE